MWKRVKWGRPRDKTVVGPGNNYLRSVTVVVVVVIFCLYFKLLLHLFFAACNCCYYTIDPPPLRSPSLLSLYPPATPLYNLLKNNVNNKFLSLSLLFLLLLNAYLTFYLCSSWNEKMRGDQRGYSGASFQWYLCNFSWRNI